MFATGIVGLQALGDGIPLIAEVWELRLVERLQHAGL
jgi:hypothetical protein